MGGTKVRFEMLGAEKKIRFRPSIVRGSVVFTPIETGVVIVMVVALAGVATASMPAPAASAYVVTRFSRCSDNFTRSRKAVLLLLLI
jgi:hypothetical protein